GKSRKARLSDWRNRALTCYLLYNTGAHSMRRLSLVVGLSTLTILLVASLTQIARADGSAGPVYYSNGSVASAAKECEAGDVCATIAEANGGVLHVATGGT